MITVPMTVTATHVAIPMTLDVAYGVVAGETYQGDYTVTPKAHEPTVLETEGLIMTDDVTVLKIPYYETSNIFDGLTVFIAEDISNG